jgi:hypothetical protein
MGELTGIISELRSCEDYELEVRGKETRRWHSQTKGRIKSIF